MLKLNKKDIKKFEDLDLLGIYIYQSKGKIIFANRIFLNFIGYTEKELISKCTLLDIIPEKCKKEAHLIIEKRLKGEVFIKEIQDMFYITKDNFLRPAMNFGYTIILDDKQSGLVIVIDTSMQKIKETLFKSIYKASFIEYEKMPEEESIKKLANVLSKIEEFEGVSAFRMDGKTPQIIFISNADLKDFHGEIAEKVKEEKNISINVVNAGYSACGIPIFLDNRIKYIIVIQTRIKDFFTIYKGFSGVSLLKILNTFIEKSRTSKFNKILTTAIDSSMDFVLITDSNFEVEYANASVLNKFGITGQQLIKQLITKDKLNNVTMNTPLLKQIAANGKIRNIIMTITSLELDKKYFVIRIIDITENRFFQSVLETYLKKDQLTGLLNRKAFINSIKRYIQRARYNNLMGAVLVINPKGFSKINEAYGFEMGNKIFVKIAERIVSFLRDYDVVARLESDRFGVLLKDIAIKENIYTIVSRLLKTLQNPYKLDDATIKLSFDLGISLYPIDSKTAEELLDKAELALVDAKLAGTNIGFYKEELRLAAQKQIKLQEEFSRAIKNGEIKLYLQPYLNANTLEVAGAEALVRWHKNNSIIPPLEFIPILEQTELIKDLDKYMVNQAINYLKNSNNNTPISVNISPKSLYDEALINLFISSVKENNLECLINIEITERTVLINIEKAKIILSKLRENGIGISIDDFGTGYSSLSYLAQLPVDYVKIDISFVRKMVTDSRVFSVVKTIIYLAKELNAKTIAEGIETEKQIELLRKVNCDYLQGFYFSKPKQVKFK